MKQLISRVLRNPFTTALITLSVVIGLIRLDLWIRGLLSIKAVWHPGLTPVEIFGLAFFSCWLGFFVLPKPSRLGWCHN